MIHLTYPGHWFDQAPPSCTAFEQHWLTRPGALTEGLRQLGPFSLRVVSEAIEKSPVEDRATMQYAVLWRREVLMCIDNEPCVIARSITPLQASHGPWQGIRRLGRRPLAEILYHDPGILRSAFEMSRIGRRHQLYQTIKRAEILSYVSRAPLARRSVFWRHHQPLMVSECFLDPFWRLAQTLHNNRQTASAL